MFDKSLKNKKIIISAGASGIGLGIAKTCLDRGAIVVATDTVSYTHLTLPTKRIV